MSNIQKPNLHFDVVTYTGNGATNNVSGLSFTPDLVWIKSRSAATDHAVYDAVRGTTKDLATNSTAAETTQSTGLTAFNSNGFTVGSLAKLNTNAATYVAWCWNAGGTTVTNTDGTITSQVRANPTAGFSVVTYTNATEGAVTVGHGLGVAPKFVIHKNRNIAYSFLVYHSSLSTNNYIVLNATAASAAASNIWQVSSTTFGTGLNNSNPALIGDHLFYCFSEVEGFSKFGSYVGNGNANGPFVYLGFRPAFVMIKRTDAAASWILFDSTRNAHNIVQNYLLSDTAGAEGSGVSTFDFVSNGFKMRSTLSDSNANAGTYIYAAFAESPFENSLAR